MRDLKIGIGIADAGGSDLEELLASYERAESEGFAAAWIPNIFGMDALTLAALAGRVTRRIELGTAVVPTFSRHPLYMAQQALTTQAATGGRLLLGLGPSHKVVIEDMLGLSFARPARHVREYVTVVKELVEHGKTRFQGETLRVNGSLDVKVERPCPVLIGALGPRMRRIAGRLADGTITWMTGRRTLAESIVPDLRRAAEAAGRPAPRVVAGFPVVLTDDPEGARRSASQAFAIYGQLPSYRAMLDAEGVAGPGDLAIVGDERAIEDALRDLASAGVTDLNAAIFPHGDGRASAQRTRELLASLARS
jgi:5,10-methylenetetrahydromethanopterin reductase